LFSNTIKSKEIDHMVGDDSTGNEVLSNGVRNLETFEDWDSVSNTIT
jgi:hypothetical protein